MKNYTIKIIILLLFLNVSCNKNNNAPTVDKNNFIKFTNEYTLDLNNKKSNETNFQILSDYSRILAVGFFDIINNQDFLNLIQESLTIERNILEINDYEIDLIKLNTIFSDNGYSLKNEIINSLNNNSHSDYVSDFELNHFTLVLNNFKHTFSVFIPAMNTDIYPNVDLNSNFLIGNTIYNLMLDNTFPTISGNEFNFEYSEMSRFEDDPIFLISSIITDKDDPSIMVNTNIIQACGKCNKSDTTGWCSMSGKGCKCDAGAEIADNIDSFKDNIPPPGTVKISDNKFIDANLITNQNWKEYVYYSKKNNNPVFYPDTTLFLNELNYYNNSCYNDYPVLSVSYEAATDYAKWRTDFVNNNLLSYSKKNKCKGVFYVKNYKKNILVLYTLPDKEELNIAMTNNLVKKSFYNEITIEKDVLLKKFTIYYSFRCVAQFVEKAPNKNYK